MFYTRWHCIASVREMTAPGRDPICKGSAKGKEIDFDEYNDFKDTITNFSHFMLYIYQEYLSFTRIN